MVSSALLWLGCVPAALFPPLFGCGVALLLSSSHSSFLLLLAALSWTAQFCGWLWSGLNHSEKYYDLTGSLTFVLLIVTSLLHTVTAPVHSRYYPSFITSLFPGLLSSDSSAHSSTAGINLSNLNVRQVVNSLLVLAWCTRLGIHLFSRIRRDQKDNRFDSMRDSAAKLLLPWSTQGLWVFLLSLPVTLTNALLTSDADGQYNKSATHSLTWRDYVGWVLWAAMWSVEVVADRQKAAFAANKDNKKNNKFIQEGLWRYSRHPNCQSRTQHSAQCVSVRPLTHTFTHSLALCVRVWSDLGEMSLWFGLFLSCSAAFTRSSHYLAIAGPCFNAFLLLFVSGLPLLEKSSDKKSACLTPAHHPPLLLSSQRSLHHVVAVRCSHPAVPLCVSVVV